MTHSTQDSLLQSGEPSRSALRAAIARAVHQLLDEPIVFDDPLALPILGRRTERLVRDDPFQFNDPVRRALRAAMAARSRLAEDELRHAVHAGVRQYVVLGAGLDTFAFRNPYQAQGLLTYEVDHPATQRWKREILAETSIAVPPTAAFVGVDFEKDALAEKLQEAGFRLDAPACFSWLGVTVYLPEQAVLDMLAFAASLPEGSSIVFDYRMPASQLAPAERMTEEHIANVFAELGEPWKSSFEPAAFQRRLRDLGFAETENLGPAELNERYFHKRKDGLQMGRGGFRFMRARI